ncbi:hypothetical protein [Enterobacter sp. 166D1]|uniref:hypothetical protein n=1 Tax=Enterobacter TaxID=547 RepID=UPI002A8001DD|nr:hypothetical protein [Enterobacter sp. 166D1]
MSTITRERAAQIAECGGFNFDEIAELARIALASLEAEPVAYVDPFAFKNFSVYRDGNTDNKRMGREWMWANPDVGLIPVYTAPPAPVSESEPMKMFGIGTVFKPKILSGNEVDCDNCAHYQPNVCHGEGCPAAMLQGADGALTNEDTKRLGELVMWVKRLANSLRKANPDSKLQSDAMDYLSQKGLIGVEDVLR